MPKRTNVSWGILVLALILPLTSCERRAKTDAIVYNPEKGLVLAEVNWGRKWRCGDFENAELQHLKFTSPNDQINLRPSSTLMVRDEFVAYILPVSPGKYELDEFDVKVAKSVSEVGHFKKSSTGGTPASPEAGGSFSVAPGQIVYIGHFGMDCGAPPFLWRNYIEGREEFERYVEDFREKHPALSKHPVHFSLFSSPAQVLGNDYSLQAPIVE